MGRVIFLFLLCTICVLLEAKAETRPSAGEVLIEIRHPEDGKWPLSVRAVIFVEATNEEVWKVLTDFDHMAEFMPHIKKSYIISRLSDEEVIVKQVFRIFILSVKLKYAIRMMLQHRIEFQGRGSKMRICRGYWGLEHTQGGTLLTCEVITHPDFYIPGWIMNWVLRKGIAEGLLAIRAKVLKNAGREEFESESNPDSLHQGEVY